MHTSTCFKNILKISGPHPPGSQIIAFISFPYFWYTVHIGYSDNPRDMEFWAKLSLYPIYHYIQYITITNYHYIQYITISNISLYPIYHYIQYITISNISLYPIITISNISLYPIYHYNQLSLYPIITISNNTNYH